MVKVNSHFLEQQLGIQRWLLCHQFHHQMGHHPPLKVQNRNLLLQHHHHFQKYLRLKTTCEQQFSLKKNVKIRKFIYTFIPLGLRCATPPPPASVPTPAAPVADGCTDSHTVYSFSDRRRNSIVSRMAKAAAPAAATAATPANKQGNNNGNQEKIFLGKIKFSPIKIINSNKYTRKINIYFFKI